MPWRMPAAQPPPGWSSMRSLHMLLHRTQPFMQMRDEYGMLQGYKPREAAAAGGRGGPAGPSGKHGAAAAGPAAAAGDSRSATAKLIDSIPAKPGGAAAAAGKGREVVVFGGEGGVGPGAITPAARAALSSSIMVPTAAGGEKEYVPSAAISRRLASKWPRPVWHAPWKNYRVISGHLG